MSNDTILQVSATSGKLLSSRLDSATYIFWYFWKRRREETKTRAFLRGQYAVIKDLKHQLRII
jgi:hypothetical protein